MMASIRIHSGMILSHSSKLFVSALLLFSITPTKSGAQTPKWKYEFPVPSGGFAVAYDSQEMMFGRSGIESLLDGHGGSLWVLRTISDDQTTALDRVVWLNTHGTPQFTNDFVSTRSQVRFDTTGTRLIRLTRSDAVLQCSVDGGRSIVRLMKTAKGVQRRDSPLTAGEHVGVAETLHGVADPKGFFTRQLEGGASYFEATNVVIRRYSLSKQ